MKPKYQLKGTLYRTQNNLADLVEVNLFFEDNNLIEARKKAFNSYENYINVFCEGKEVSHAEAEQLLKDFTDSYKKEYARGIKELEIDVDSDKGLYIYFITDPSDTYRTKEGELIYNKKILIHYIDNNFSDSKKMVLANLSQEFQYYKTHNLPTDGEGKEYKYLNSAKKSKTISILETPINFNNLK